MRFITYFQPQNTPLIFAVSHAKRLAHMYFSSTRTTLFFETYKKLDKWKRWCLIENPCRSYQEDKHLVDSQIVFSFKESWIYSVNFTIYSKFYPQNVLTHFWITFFTHWMNLRVHWISIKILWIVIKIIIEYFMFIYEYFYFYHWENKIN